MRYTSTLAGLALALATLAAPLQAQQLPPAGGPQPQLPDSIQMMVQEFQSLRAHVGQVQDSALQANPGLVEEQSAIQAFIEAKMIEAQPGLEQDIERLETLRTAAEEAQAAQDTARFQEIMREGGQLQSQLAAAQSAALQREDVQARVQSFEDSIVAAMEAIDADIDEAMARMETLAERLQAFQAGG